MFLLFLSVLNVFSKERAIQSCRGQRGEPIFLCSIFIIIAITIMAFPSSKINYFSEKAPHNIFVIEGRWDIGKLLGKKLEKNPV